MSSQQQKINKLERTILKLESENHQLKRQIKHCEFERYKFLEVQRLAKAGTWELNHLTYELSVSEQLSRLLFSEDETEKELSWQGFLDLFEAYQEIDIKQEFYENVFKDSDGLDFEHFMRRSDGKILFVRHHCKTFFNPIGQPLITVGLIHDFTDEHDLQVKLKNRSITDELTQLINRRRINDVLQEQYDIFQRFGTTSSYIMLDLDHFKRVNDEHGHQVGDEVLRKLGIRVKQMIRSIDSAGRWGGEEFLIICPQTSCEHAEHLAEKLRLEVMKLDISCGITVCASFGVGELKEGESIEHLIKRVDDALYQAKATGRNKVVSAG